MQTVTAAFLDALQGSVRPVMRVDAWYDGRLVLGDVPVIGGSVTLDGNRAIHGAASLVAGSPDDTLVPSRWDAPLAPYGSECQIRCGIQTGPGATEMVSLGWFRLDSSDPSEWWANYRPEAQPELPEVWVCRGVKVAVQASDRLSILDDNRFLAPESPSDLSSVITEIKRITRDLIPIADLSAIGDAPIPAGIAYQSSRIQAVQDLADVLGRVARMDPDGALTLVPKTVTGDPVWTVKVGRDDGQIIDWGRKLDRQRLYNGVVSSGTGPDGVPVQGVATEETGPLRWGGPFGRVPYGHSSPLITTGDIAQDDAFTRLARLIEERVVPVTVRCPANYALQLDDIVRVELPDATLDGPISSITWPLPGGEMVLVVMVPRSQLWR